MFWTDFPLTDHYPSLQLLDIFLWQVSGQHLAGMLVWERLVPALQLSHRRVTLESNQPSSGALRTIQERCGTKTAGKRRRVEAMEITDSANKFHFDLMLPRCSGDMTHSTVSIAGKERNNNKKMLAFRFVSAVTRRAHV